MVENFVSLEDFRIKLTRQLSLKIGQHNYFKSIDKTTDKIVLDKEENDLNLANKLSIEEKLLISEASSDAYGRVLKLSKSEGLAILTNRKRINEDLTARTSALWNTNLNSLTYKGLIEEKGSKGEVFVLTHLGYKIADIINKG